MEEYKYVTIKSPNETADVAKQFIDSLPRQFIHRFYSIECRDDAVVLEWHGWHPPSYETGNTAAINGHNMKIKSSILSDLRLPASLEDSLSVLINYKENTGTPLPANVIGHLQMLEAAGLVEADLHNEFVGLKYSPPQMIFQTTVRSYSITSNGYRYVEKQRH